MICGLDLLDEFNHLNPTYVFNRSYAIFRIRGRISEKSHFLRIFPPLVSVSCLLTQQPSSPQMDFFTQTLSHARGAAAAADCKNWEKESSLSNR